MPKYLTDTDREVISHIEEFGFITISQCYKIFYKDLIYGYDVARKKLKRIEDFGYIKSSNVRTLNFLEKYYYMDDKYQNIVPHRKLKMDFYANLRQYGVAKDKIWFQQEFEWLKGKYKSDAFAIYEWNDMVYYQIVEICTSNNDMNRFNEKYNEIYTSQEPQKYCNGQFPTIILVDERNYKTPPIKNPNINLIQIQFNMSDFHKVLA